MARNNYAQVGIDPENYGGTSTPPDTAAQLMEPGTVVWKNGRAYLYVTFDNTTGNPALPAKGGLVYMLSAATWGSNNGYNVVAGASGLTDATNHSLHVAGMVIGTQTKGNYGFVQVRGTSFVPLSTDSGVTLVGQNVAGNLSNATTPAQALLYTVKSVSGNADFYDYVGKMIQAAGGNSGNADLDIGAYA